MASVSPPSRLTSPPASRFGSIRLIGRPRRRASSAAASPTRARRSSTARSIARRSMRTCSHSIRQGGLKIQGSRMEEQLFHDRGAADRQRRIDHRGLRRRVRHPRLHRRLDPETGKQLWRRYTIPARGENGNETWPQDTKAWVGGGSSWITGSYSG